MKPLRWKGVAVMVEVVVWERKKKRGGFVVWSVDRGLTERVDWVETGLREWAWESGCWVSLFWLFNDKVRLVFSLNKHKDLKCN